VLQRARAVGLLEILNLPVEAENAPSKPSNQPTTQITNYRPLPKTETHRCTAASGAVEMATRRRAAAVGQAGSRGGASGARCWASARLRTSAPRI
jgi:hypothetical protein